MHQVWLSDSKEFALSWNDRSSITDCFRHLTITDQGYAIQISRRKSRDATSPVGVITSNQLAAQLLVMEGSVQFSMVSLFRHAIQALCDRTNALAVALRCVANHSDPSYAYLAWQTGPLRDSLWRWIRSNPAMCAYPFNFYASAAF